jgi:hypothetical protein
LEQRVAILWVNKKTFTMLLAPYRSKYAKPTRLKGWPLVGRCRLAVLIAIQSSRPLRSPMCQRSCRLNTSEDSHSPLLTRT